MITNFLKKVVEIEDVDLTLSIEYGINDNFEYQPRGYLCKIPIKVSALLDDGVIFDNNFEDDVIINDNDFNIVNNDNNFEEDIIINENDFISRSQDDMDMEKNYLKLVGMGYDETNVIYALNETKNDYNMALYKLQNNEINI